MSDAACTECGAPVHARGLCTRHYHQQRRNQPLRPGRASPGSGATELLQVSINGALLLLVDQLAAEASITRAEWCRQAIEQRLDRDLEAELGRKRVSRKKVR